MAGSNEYDWQVGDLADQGAYAGLGGDPSHLATTIKNWWTNQPSWLSRAQAENQRTAEAYQRGGMGEIARQLATDTTEAQDLASGFGGNIKGVRPPVVPGALAATSEYRPPFYSAVEQAVQGAKQNAAPGQQWAGFLRNQPGVKPEEVEALKLGKLFEQPGSVPKEAVLGEIAANRVNVGEVYKGGERPKTFSVSSAGNLSGAPALRMDFATLEEANRELLRREAAHGGYHSIAELPTPESRTKFEQYTLPGGENYREMLLTLPQKGEGKPRATAQQLAELAGDDWATLGPNGRQRYQDQARQRGTTGEFRSSHYDEPNILAHVRYNDRVIDGKKTLFVEEVQSDWHQKGKREGYVERYNKNELSPAEGYADPNQATWYVKAPDNVFQIPKSKAATFDDAVDYIVREKTKGTGSIPDAPFKTAWPELAMKRIIREAAEKGYDKVAWTPGSVQAARYPEQLRQHVDEIAWSSPGTARSNPEGLRYVHAKPRAGGMDLVFTVNKDGMITEASAAKARGQHVEDIFGKDMSRQIMEKADGEIASKDFVIGAKGQQGFYDEILPATVNKLVKKHGGRVQQSEISAGGRLLNETEHMPGRPADVKLSERGGGYTITLDGSDTTWGLFGDERAARARMSALQEAWDKAKTPVHTLDITPSLRAAAMKGFPLFSAGGVAATGVIGGLARQDEYQ